MNRFSRFVLVTTAIVGVGGLIAATAQADGRWNRDGDGRGGYHERHGGSGFGGHGFGKGRGMMRMFEDFDTDGDGALTQEEIDAFRTARLAQFDADGDGALTLAEYQALWLDAMRERMVDAFQRLDDDGDAVVTLDEYKAPFARMVARADRNEDGKLDRDDRPQRGKHHDMDDDDDRR